jgi:lipopolysaccharide exporter
LVFLKTTIEDFDLLKKISFQKIKENAIRFRKFPQYNLAASLAVSGSVYLTPFLLVLFFSPIIVGYYAMAYMIIALPSKLVGNSLYSVFYQKACMEKNQTGSISNVAKMVHTRLVSIGLFIFLIIVIAGPELFSFALGPQWSTAGEYAQVLAPWFFVVFLSTPLISIFNVLEMQGANLRFNLLLLITRVVVLLIGGLYGDPLLALILFSGTGVIFWSWMNMYLLKIAGVSVKGALWELTWHLVFGTVVCLPLIIAKYIVALPSKYLIVIAIVLSILYYTIIIFRDAQMREGILTFFTKSR